MDLISSLWSWLGSEWQLCCEKNDNFHVVSFLFPNLPCSLPFKVIKHNCFYSVKQLISVLLLPEVIRVKIEATCWRKSSNPTSGNPGGFGNKHSDWTQSLCMIMGSSLKHLVASISSRQRKMWIFPGKILPHLLAHSVGSPGHKPQKHPCMPCELGAVLSAPSRTQTVDLCSTIVGVLYNH